MITTETLQRLQQEIANADLGNHERAEAFRIHYLGAKGIIKNLFEEFKSVPADVKKETGAAINRIKIQAEERYAAAIAAATNSQKTTDHTDYTLPGALQLPGSRHPLNIIRDEVLEIFQCIGFEVAEGPEIEDDWHNFGALNFAPDHPARDMQDTFFLSHPHTHAPYLLRTHTSSVQVRTMEQRTPPIRIVAPGRVFRNEAISARSHCIFHQVEGLYIDEGVSFADLVQCLEYFASKFFGKSKIRLRPSYFPFTEPSAEMDVYWGLETEVDKRITKGTGWLEVMGCGMVDPAVLSACGIDPDRYSGYAFGMGLERSAMQRFHIPDIRMMFENDVRFIGQFRSAL